MGVWVGFDDNSPLGRETGGVAALPIWMGVMRQAMINMPSREFEPPDQGVVFAPIDLHTGLLADEGSEGSMLLPFLTGTEPRESANQAVRKDFYDQE